MCTECGHPAAAPYVTEALWLQQQSRILAARLAWVRDRIAASDPVAKPLTIARQPLAVPAILLGVGAMFFIIATLVFIAVTWNRLGQFGQIIFLTMVVATSAVASYRARIRYRITAETLAALAAAIAAIALLAAPKLGLGSAWTRDHPALWAAIAFGLVAAGSAVMAVPSRLTAWRVGFIVSSTAAAGLGAIGGRGDSPVSPVIVACIGAGAAALLRARQRDLRWVGMSCTALALLWGLAAYLDLDHHWSWAFSWLALVLALATTSAGKYTAVASGIAIGQIGPFLAHGNNANPWILATGAAVLGAGFLALTAAPPVRSVPENTLTLFVAAGTSWVIAPVVVLFPADASPGPWADYLGIVAASLFIGSFQRLRWWLSWAAAVTGSAAAWVLLASTTADTWEIFATPAVGFLLFAGWVTSRSLPAIGSVVTMGPALSLALLPSAIFAVGQAAQGQSAARAVGVILLGVIFTAVGTAFALRAPFVVGLVAAGIAATGQLLALADLVPRWAVLAGGGGLLIATGFGYERIAHTGKRAHRFTAGLR
jgi:hypothetical protein